MASLSAAALGWIRGRPSAARRDDRALAALSAGDAVERDLHRLAVAACGRQNRAPAARLSEAVAPGAGPDAQTGPVRDLLFAGDGAVPGHSHAQVQGQTPGDR